MDSSKLNFNSLELWKKADKLSKDLASDSKLQKSFESDMIGVLRKYELDMNLLRPSDGLETQTLLQSIENMDEEERLLIKIALKPASLHSKSEILMLKKLNPNEEKAKDFVEKFNKLVNELKTDKTLAKRYADDLYSVLSEKNMDFDFYFKKTGKVESFLSVVKSVDLDARRLIGKELEKSFTIPGEDRMFFAFAFAVAIAAAGVGVGVVAATTVGTTNSVATTNVVATEQYVVTNTSFWTTSSSDSDSSSSSSTTTKTDSEGKGWRQRDDIYENSAYSWRIHTELTAKFTKSLLSKQFTALGLNAERQQALLKEAVIKQLAVTNKRGIVQTALAAERVVATYEYQGVHFQVTADVKANSITILDANIL
jgi:hypothetical protein